MKYVVKRKGKRYYILMVAEHVNALADDVEWDISYTDIPHDATKFTFINEAFWAVDLLGLEDECEVVPLEGVNDQ